MSGPIIHGDGGPGTVVNLEPPAGEAATEPAPAKVDEAPHDEPAAKKAAPKRRGGRRVAEPAADAPLHEAPED